MTPLYWMCSYRNNGIFIKRDDLIPFCFGGNKARKAQKFFEKIDLGCYDCVVTYGSSSSNHCRVVSNLAASRGLKCYIIGPKEASKPTYNSKMMDMFGAEITVVPVNEVHDTIERKLQMLRDTGRKPYFIPGGGHGNLGTQAYVDCYEEIRTWEREHGKFFDFVFLASGTGTTQAGLVCGQLIREDDRKIIGISVARKCPYGRNVVLDSISDYLGEKGVAISQDNIEKCTVFDDEYTADGYGNACNAIYEAMNLCLIKYGVPLDHTYTGKAFYGMLEFLKKHEVENKNVLFLHTGGTPLFFDDLK